MKDTGGLDSDLPQLPDPGSTALTERVQEVNELVRHLWNLIHGVNSKCDDHAVEDKAALAMVRDLKREIMQSIERLPADYAKVYNSAVIAVYSLLR